tara:strand:- start:225 stop:548 length:324 start_codon:yes stop_codon:yes gene_type:complete
VKKLLRISLVTILLVTPVITYGQNNDFMCNRMEGCPIINGECPTCVGKKVVKKPLDPELMEMLNRMRENHKKRFGPDLSKRYAKPSGWGVIRWNINEALRVRKDFDF